jgi:hypothetical protein
MKRLREDWPLRYFNKFKDPNLSPIFLLVQVQLVQLLVGSLVGLLVVKSYHTKQKDGYSLPTNDPTNNRTNWIWTSKKIGLYLLTYLLSFLCRKNQQCKIKTGNVKKNLGFNIWKRFENRMFFISNVLQILQKC